MDNKEKYLREFSYLKRERSPAFTYKLPQHVYIDYLTNLYEQYLPKKNDLSSAQQKSLNDIYNSLRYIDEALSPFRKYNIPYNLGVTGGAVYDLVTDNAQLTKDIDIVLNFDIKDFRFSDGEIDKKFINDIEKLLQEKCPEKLNPQHLYSLNDINFLVNQFIYQSFNVNNEKSTMDFKAKAYQHKFLLSLLKLEHEELNKPIDLMVALTPVQQYCISFDFDICKNYIYYRKSPEPEIQESHKDFMEIVKLLQGPKNEDTDLATQVSLRSVKPEELLDHLYLSPAALQDLDNKTLTMLVSSFEEENIHFYMEHHYPRLKEKLPHFQLNFRSYNDKNQEVAACYIFNERIALPNNINTIKKIDI